MGSFRLCHRATGTVISGYRVLSATEEEIARANHRMREVGCQFRFVPDMHPPRPQGERAIADAPTTLALSAPAT